jgi:hypothetical protein
MLLVINTEIDVNWWLLLISSFLLFGKLECGVTYFSQFDLRERERNTLSIMLCVRECFAHFM